MLTRKIETLLIQWVKNSKKALLLEGARQVGKTFSIRKVLTSLECNYIEFNLIQNPELIKILAKINTVEDLITNLSLFSDKPFVKDKTFIFFDEIQEYKEIITKLKFLVDEGSYRYIFSGSLLGVELKNIKSAPVGYLSTLTMFPLDFEEFLQLYNYTPELKHSLYESFTEHKPVNEVVHKRLLQLFNIYLNVGGMPAAVEKFKQTKDLELVVLEHEDIILQYKKDFTKYETDDKKLFLTKIYDLIPSEINKPNKRFNYADVKKGLRFERNEENFVWLSSAGMAIPVYNTTVPTLPLLLNSKMSLLKLFLSDIGLLTTLYGRTAKRSLLTDDTNINNGAIYENIVAQELKAHKFDLYYYNSKKFGELDFVIEYKGRVLPIEVKSGKVYHRHSALNNILSNDEYDIEEAFVLSDYNVKVKDRIVYYPIYMVMFLAKDEEKLPKVELDDLSSLV